MLGHVNNTVYWAPLEDQLVGRGGSPVTRIEMEYRAGIDPGDDVELVSRGDDPIRVWFRVDGEVRASAAR